MCLGLTLHPPWKFFMLFVVWWFFLNQLFRKIISWNPIWVSNSLDPDQAWQSVGPDLGLNCLQRYQQTTSHGLKEWVCKKSQCCSCGKVSWKSESLESSKITLILKTIFFDQNFTAVKDKIIICDILVGFLTLFNTDGFSHIDRYNKDGTVHYIF